MKKTQSNCKRAFLKHFAFIMCLVLCGIFCAGCANSEPFADDDGNPIYYKENELRTGIYIQFPDNTYRRPLPVGMRFTGDTKNLDESRIVWIKGTMEYLIPEVNSDTRFIYISEAKLPEEMYLEHFADTCYSFGALFTTNEDGSISFSGKTSDICEYSSLSRALDAEVGATSNTIVTELGTAQDIDAPFSAGLLSEWGYVTGLTANSAYKIGYYEGTKYNSFYVSADTHYFHQDNIFPIDGFSTTKEGYFVIELPENLPSGLYCINGVGIFNYTSGLAPSMGGSSLEDEGVIPSETLDPQEEIIQDTIGSGAPPSSNPVPPATDNLEAPSITIPTETPGVLNPEQGVLNPEQGLLSPDTSDPSVAELTPIG